MNNIDKIKQMQEKWYKDKNEKSSQRKTKFITVSGEQVEELGTPLHLEGFDYMQQLAFPGQYPFTRGIHPNMYRGRLWTMRQFAGFGSPEDSNKRYHYLLKEGQGGLSIAFDLPTLMGRDADDPLSEGEVGLCGVSISSLQDMEILLDKIPLDKISTSMTINSPAAIFLAFYIAVAEKQGISSEKLTGTMQNDILKEYIAQKEYIFPPQESMRIIVDMIEYCTENMPQWNTISVSGYHIREAGSTALQEWRLPLPMDLHILKPHLKEGLILTISPRGCHSFLMHIMICLKRLQSTGLPDEYGPDILRKNTEPRMKDPCC